MPEKVKRSIPLMITIICAVTLLESIALIRGIDGKCFGLAIAAICLAGGLTIGKLLK